jgi:hypothetical protein
MRVDSFLNLCSVKSGTIQELGALYRGRLSRGRRVKKLEVCMRR